jgi:ATP synthase F1 delta subunit
LDHIREQLGEFTDVLDSQRELQVFFFSPYFSTEEKKRGLERAVKDGDPTLMNFLDLLLEKHRMTAIFRTRRQFDALWQEENRRLPVKVVSAVELDRSIVQQIVDTISKQTGRTIDLSTEVQPNILGGIVIKAGNVVLDASIHHSLEQLRKQVAKAA